MKNLFLLFMVVLALNFSASASNAVALVNVSVVTVNQEKEYKVIEASAVASDVLAQVEKHYEDYNLVEAAVAADGEYKLVLSKEGATITALFTAEGSFIKEV